MPAKSKAQFRAMQAAAHGHSTLGIPKSVGEDFASATGSTKGLPEHVKHGKAGNPARPEHNPHEMEAELVRMAHKPGHHRTFASHSNMAQREHHGDAEGHHGGGPQEHFHGGLSYMRGSQQHNRDDPREGEVLGSHSPDRIERENFAQREHHDGKFGWDRSRVGHHASFAHEAEEFGSENLKDNLGSKRKDGHGEPQGGLTSLPETPGIKGGHSAEHHQGYKMPEHGLADRGMHSTPHQDLEDETRGTHLLPHHPMAMPHEVHQEHVERIARALVRARR